MIRNLILVFCVACVATVLTEVLGVAYLWTQGQLTPQTLADIRAVLAGEDLGASPVESEADEKTAPSTDDITRQRINRVWNLQRRQNELAVIKAMVFQQAGKVDTQRSEFEKQKQKFLADLKQQSRQLQSAATEQARGILAQLPPTDAVQNLMALDLNRNIVLLKGMSDRVVAKLLKEFLNSGDAKVAERGQHIFEAISRGDPQRQLVENTLQQFPAAGKKTVSPKESASAKSPLSPPPATAER